MIEAHECRVWGRYREAARRDDEKHERDDAWADAAMSAEARAMMAGLHFPKLKPHPKRGPLSDEEVAEMMRIDEAADYRADEERQAERRRKLGKKKRRKAARVSA